MSLFSTCYRLICESKERVAAAEAKR